MKNLDLSFLCERNRMIFNKNSDLVWIFKCGEKNRFLFWKHQFSYEKWDLVFFLKKSQIFIWKNADKIFH